MDRQANIRRHQSHSGFILINGATKEEQPVKWEWLTQRGFRPQPEIKVQTEYPRVSYSEKKSILSDLQSKERKVSSFTLREGWNRNEVVRTVSTANCKTAVTDRKVKPFVYLHCNEKETAYVKFGVNEEQLHRRMAEAMANSRKILALITVQRLGLRYKASHFFVEYCPCLRPSHSHDLRDLTLQAKSQMKELSRIEKELYYFHLNGVPIHRYEELVKGGLYVLIVDSSPKLHFNFDLQDRIIELATSIEAAVLKFNAALSGQESLQTNEDEDT